IEGGFENHVGYSISGRTSSGVRIFNVAKGEQIVGAALIDETTEPENEAEEAVVEEMVGRHSPETTPDTTMDRDSNEGEEPPE
ncbi:MAG: hypothetical protein EX262_09370, partial [Sphingomonadaceae bacterium]